MQRNRVRSAGKFGESTPDRENHLEGCRTDIGNTKVPTGSLLIPEMRQRGLEFWPRTPADGRRVILQAI